MPDLFTSMYKLGVFGTVTSIRCNYCTRKDSQKCILLTEEIAGNGYTSKNEVLGAVGKRGLTFINESGIHKAMMGSTKPEAVAFQDWVCEEVLPSIKKYGVYAPPPTIQEMIAT